MAQIVRLVSDAEIDAVATEIFDSIRLTFDSPRDAASAMTMAHYKLLVETYRADEQKDAIKSIEDTCTLLKKFITERVD